MSVLITGGAGYIGSHTALALLDAGMDIVIADNFSNSSPKVIERLRRISGRDIAFENIDLTDKTGTESLFCRYPISSVIHFAGLKAVGESVEKPLLYFRNNLSSTLNLLEAMARHGVSRFVFSSSATVYGDPDSVPIREDAPLNVTNPYGRTKLMTEDILRDCAKADKSMRICLLRYFNPIGAHESGLIGEAPNGVPNNLLPYIAQVATGKRPYLRVFGDDYPTPDGTGVRDYIHVCDLAAGHLAALKRLDDAPGVYTYNLGTGKGYSVLEVLHAFERACGKTLPYVIAPRRPGDVAACYADPSKAAEELGWTAKLDLDRMCRDSWRWTRLNPEGYDS